MVNSAAAALVSAAAIAAILGVHSAAVGSEVRIAGEAADMIASTAAASNEALSAAYDAPSRSLVVRNHGAAPARLFMVDVAAGAMGDDALVRVALAPGGYAAPPGLIVVNGSMQGGSREVAPGEAVSVPLAGALGAASAALPPGAPPLPPHPYSAAVTTDAGTRVAAAGLPPASLQPQQGTGTGTGTAPAGNGTATINGMGINSRLAHVWRGGFAVEGSGTGAGTILVPAGPYISTDGAADDFVGVVLGGDLSDAAAVPSLSGSYAYGPGGSLAPGGGRGEGGVAPLSYAAKRTLEGSPSVVRGEAGLQLRGPGRVLLELHAGERGSALFLSGAASGGAELFVGASPYDLSTQAYAAGRGFEVWRGPAAAPSSQSGFDAPCPPQGRSEFSASYRWDVPSVPVGLRGLYSHGAAASVNNNLPDPATGLRGEALVPAAARIELGQGGAGGGTSGTSGGGLYGTVGGLSMRSGGAPQLNGPVPCSARPAAVLPSIYDEAPVAEALAVVPGGAGYGAFEAVLAAPGSSADRTYAIAHLDGPSAAASLSSRQLSPGEALLSVRGLPPTIPYRVASGGETLAAGVTSGAGGIALAAPDMGLGPGARPAAALHCGFPAAAACPPAAGSSAAPAAGGGAAQARAPGAVLHLYRDSFAVRGGLDEAVAYDPLHNASLAVPSWRADTVYVVHAWARIPAVGHVSVSGAALNGTLPLPFVDGERGAAGPPGRAAAPEYVHVPVVPRYTHVSMSVNGVPAALAFADAAAAGGGGASSSSVRILLPSSSGSRVADPGGAVAGVAAQAGSASAYVAPHTGTLGAVFAVQASGSARVDNTHVLRGAGGDPGWRFNATAAVPGPPPAGWPPDAPVSAHVVVRVNGDAAGTVRLESASRHGDAAQGGGYSSSAGAGSVLVSASHGPLVHDARGSAAVPVRAGDLVEFEVVARASAHAPPYAPPPGAEVSRSTGSASAAASILSGTVIAGM